MKESASFPAAVIKVAPIALYIMYPKCLSLSSNRAKRDYIQKLCLNAKLRVVRSMLLYVISRHNGSIYFLLLSSNHHHNQAQPTSLV